MSLLDIARELGAARRAWAEDFLAFRAVHADTDNKARAMADARNIENITLLEAKLELAKWRLNHASDAPFGADDEPTATRPDDEGAGEAVVQDCGD